jgi:hypothetical protein
VAVEEFELCDVNDLISYFLLYVLAMHIAMGSILSSVLLHEHDFGFWISTFLLISEHGYPLPRGRQFSHMSVPGRQQPAHSPGIWMQYGTKELQRYLDSRHEFNNVCLHLHACTNDIFPQHRPHHLCGHGSGLNIKACISFEDHAQRMPGMQDIRLHHE